MSKFLSLYYYFNFRVISDTGTVKVMLAFFAVLVIVGIAIKIYTKVKKLHHIDDKLLDKYFAMLVVMGFVGILLTWFRYEGAYFVSARLWMVVWVIGIIIWLANILRFQFKVVPEAKKQAEQKKNFLKYLPKKK